MKKNKMIGVLAISSMMGLSGCNLLGSSGCSHQWSPWEESEPSTCIERGIRERYCILCGDMQSRSIPVDTINGHLWLADPSSDKEATCSTEGVTGSKYCFRCYSRMKGTTTELGRHTMVLADPQPSDSKYHPATCTEDGLYQYKCRDCGVTEDKFDAKKGHIEGSIERPLGETGMGIVKCSGCNNIMGYQLDITNAEGYRLPSARMYETSGEKSKSTWDISRFVGTVIPEAAYDIEIEAAMSDAAYGIRKFYNMARTDLRVDGDAEANTTQSVGSPDDVNGDPYRYFMKVDAVNYYPTTKDSFADLGMQVGVGNWRYCKFIEGVNIDKDSSKIELIHGNLNYPLYIKSIRFIKHDHEIIDDVENAAGDRVGYVTEKCYCGYRKIAIKAADGTPSAALDTSAPEGTVLLNADDDSITYKVNVSESITGGLYLVGKQKVANKDQTPFNIEVENNGEAITGDWAGKKSSDYFDFEEGANADEYSKESRILIGEITLLANANGGSNVIKITRKGDYNIAMSQLVVEARPTGHIHNFDHVSDDAPTCHSDKIEHYVCSCGQYKDIAIDGTRTPHHLVKDYEIPASCESTGLIVKKCDNEGCRYNEQIVTPKAHEMATTTVGVPDGARYEYKECTSCHKASEATWMLEDDMIEDYDGNAYGAASVTAKTGKMSDGITSFTVYKFDKANRRVVLSYKHNGSTYVKAKLSIFGTTKASNISSCQAYQQTDGNNKGKKLEVTANGYTYTYGPDIINKNVGDLGLKNVESQVNDGGLLADPVWMEYLEIDVKPGDNEIVIEAPVKTDYSLYIGGFRISY